MTDKNKPIIYYSAGFWRVRYAEGMEWKKLTKLGQLYFKAAYTWVNNKNQVAFYQLSA